MAGTSEGAKKAAQSRSPEERRETARKTGQESHKGGSQSQSRSGSQSSSGQGGRGRDER